MKGLPEVLVLAVGQQGALERSFNLKRKATQLGGKRRRYTAPVARGPFTQDRREDAPGRPESGSGKPPVEESRSRSSQAPYATPSLMGMTLASGARSANRRISASSGSWTGLGRTKQLSPSKSVASSAS